MSKLIINAAITGCVLSQKDTPHLPVTLHEIVDCVKTLRDLGVAIVHLHARGANQIPSHRSEDYIELVNAVRAACPDILICVSLSGRHEPRLEARAAALESKPDFASLTLGSMNFITGPSVNSPETIQGLAQHMNKTKVIPELEVFEAGFIHYANYLIAKDILKPPYYFNLIFGSLGTAPLDLLGLGHMISMLPNGAIWSVGGLGKWQLPANTLAIAAGGHVRVGLEDNIHYNQERSVLATNPQLVERIVRIAKELGREPASPQEARAILGISRA
jgi:3-keto-5-aminohexanoate cleavage enzyme